MLLFVPGDPASRLFLVELDRLKSIVADMEQIACGAKPENIVQGRDTPMLNHWAPATREEPVLFGASSGHPLLPGSDRPIVTRSLYLMATDGSWARTRSRWYRLGEKRTAARHTVRKL